ncbi:MAG: hypothetical protein ACK5AJ_12220 [bacterium]|jgi:hypothetical protein
MKTRQHILRLMEEAISSHDYDKFVQYEMIHYSEYIKKTEEKKHYEECLTDVEKMSERYGDVLKKEAEKYDGESSKAICYFLPSIDNDLAHIEILSRILAQHKPSDFRILVAGYSSRIDGCSSKFLTALEQSGKIDLVPLKQTHASLVSFITWLNHHKVAHLIVMSIPTLIPAFIAALGSDRVTWFSSKFELECFPSLANRISCCGYEYQVQQVGNSIWHRMPAALDPANIPEFKKRKIIDGSCKLVSINREEKIKNPDFLKSVVSILKKNTKATFFWTGRTEDAAIKLYLDNQGVGQRCRYIGWVHPVEALNEFDIFLDTPSLSGSVAATAFTAGIPLVTFRNSQSWIEFFEPKFHQNIENKESSTYSLPLIATNSDEYIKMATLLINDSNLYNEISEYQKLAGSTHFFDKKTLYHSHLKYIQKVTNMEIA